MIRNFIRLFQALVAAGPRNNGAGRIAETNSCCDACRSSVWVTRVRCALVAEKRRTEHGVCYTAGNSRSCSTRHWILPEPERGSSEANSILRGAL